MTEPFSELYTKPRYQYIEWIDSCSGDSWNTVDVELAGAYRENIKTVGFLLKENKDWVCICNSMNADGDNLGRLWIPKVAIKKRKDIKFK